MVKVTVGAAHEENEVVETTAPQGKAFWLHRWTKAESIVAERRPTNKAIGAPNILRSVDEVAPTTFQSFHFEAPYVCCKK